MLAVWSRRAVLACVVGWAVLITAYVLLAVLHQQALPSPYNILIALVLATATAAAVGARTAAYIDGRLAEMERRDALLYAQGGRMEMGLRQFMEGPTLVLPRQRIVATVAAPSGVLTRTSDRSTAPAGLDPEVLDLARRLSAQIHPEE